MEFCESMVIHCILCLMLAGACNSSPLPSSFYQPGPGVILEQWVSTTLYSMDSFDSIPDYPHCPAYVSNSDTFEYNMILQSRQKVYGRFRAFFVTTQTGKHRFFAILNNKARVYIDLNPNGRKKILDLSYITTDDWSQRKWCDEVTLLKGFRYELTVYYYGNGYNPDFFRLGVRFPDNTEIKPIPKTFLRRSLEYYKWNGLIAQKYDNFTFPSNAGSYPLEYTYNNNPNYPDTPSSFTCKSSLYDAKTDQNFGDNFALRYIGYMRPPADGTYKLEMGCDDVCELFINKSGIETSIGSLGYGDYWVTGEVLMQLGAMSENVLYPIKIFMGEGSRAEFLRIRYQRDNGGLISSWEGMLQNLETVETTKNIPLPILTVINSTAISIQLLSTPFLPPKDQWTYIRKHEVLYHKNGVEEPLMKITITDALPKTVVATGLKKCTDYVFYARYYGKINGEDQNIITKSTILKTEEYENECAQMKKDQIFTNLHYNGKSLANHECNTTLVTSVEECFRHCLKIRDINDACTCHSININRTMNGGKMICEINAGDREMFPFEFINRKGYQYYGVA